MDILRSLGLWQNWDISSTSVDQSLSNLVHLNKAQYYQLQMVVQFVLFRPNFVPNQQNRVTWSIWQHLLNSEARHVFLVDYSEYRDLV